MPWGCSGGDDAIWLDTMLQAIQFPTRIAHLDASLADVDRNALPLRGGRRKEEVMNVL